MKSEGTGRIAANLGAHFASAASPAVAANMRKLAWVIGDLEWKRRIGIPVCGSDPLRLRGKTHVEGSAIGLRVIEAHCDCGLLGTSETSVRKRWRASATGDAFVVGGVRHFGSLHPKRRDVYADPVSNEPTCGNANKRGMGRLSAGGRGLGLMILTHLAVEMPSVVRTLARDLLLGSFFGPWHVDASALGGLVLF